MRDSAKPSLFIKDVGSSISINVSASDTLVEEQGLTYNQAGLTYNQTGIMYGGVYKTGQDIIPILNSASFITPSMVIESTNALLEDQGYTYNQAGFSYNRPGVMYGGIYNQNQDVIPLMSMANLEIPSISGFIDLYTPFVPPPKNSGMLMGILGLTYP